jgi:hypothetical protein
LESILYILSWKSPGQTDRLAMQYSMAGAFLLAALGIMALIQTIRNRSWRWESPIGIVLRLLWIFILAGLQIFLVRFFLGDNPFLISDLGPNLVWFLVLSLFSALSWAQQPVAQGLSAANPGLSRTKSVDISGVGITVCDPFSRSESQWQAFATCHETKSLFLLFTDPKTCLMLPKRAFASEEELNAMRALMRFVGIRGSGFSIQPVTTAPQNPAVPFNL